MTYQCAIFHTQLPQFRPSLTIIAHRMFHTKTKNEQESPRFSTVNSLNSSFLWFSYGKTHGFPMVCPWFTHGLPLLHHVAGERQGHLRAGAKVGTHRHISSALDEKRLMGFTHYNGGLMGLLWFNKAL